MKKVLKARLSVLRKFANQIFQFLRNKKQTASPTSNQFYNDRIWSVAIMAGEYGCFSSNFILNFENVDTYHW